LVQARFQGGISVVDFTDLANPVAIAYFDRDPVYAEHFILGGFWSAYWYNGKTHGTGIRGTVTLILSRCECGKQSGMN